MFQQLTDPASECMLVHRGKKSTPRHRLSFFFMLQIIVDFALKFSLRW